MRQIISRFSLEAAKFNWQVFACLLIIWMVLVVCAIVSIRSQGFTDRQQRLWIAIVAGVPVLGLLIYLPFSIRTEDLPQLLLLVLQKNRMAKKMKKSASSTGKRAA